MMPATVATPRAAHESWRECSHCGLFSALPEPPPPHALHCPRCDHALWRARRESLHFPLACGLAALLFYIFALVGPFLEITEYGRFQLARIATGPVQLTDQGYRLTALLVLAVTMIIPGIKLAILLLTLTGLETRSLPAALMRRLFRWYAPLSPWAMVDVYLVGFLVAYIRLTDLASVHVDTALFALIGLMVCLAAVDANLDHDFIWRALDRHRPSPPAPSSSEPGDLIGCHACGLLNHAHAGAPCRRCHATLHPRKPDSLNRSWALLSAAALLYIPANIYPVMVLTELGRTYPYTIMGGIRELLDENLWPLALLVFCASIMIPLIKLLALGYMLLATRKGSTLHLVGRTRIFRSIDFIGRWSMIDVFMISILVALVRFGEFADVRADLGAPCFAAVVVLTLFAVSAFDPRLMWDASIMDKADATAAQAAGSTAKQRPI